MNTTGRTEYRPGQDPEYRESRRAGNGKRKQGGLLKKISTGLTSLAGIATAIATITTSAAAVLGVTVHDKSTQLQQANAHASAQAQRVGSQQQEIRQQAQKIQQQTRQIQHLQSAATTASSTGNTGAASLSGAVHYLSNATPTVDNNGVNTGQQVISAKPYVNSITWGCGAAATPNEAYDVAGSSTFTAEVGIPDNMQGATDVVATVTFTDESGQQIGQPVQVSLGHPVSLRLNIKGVTQLGVTCDGRDRQTNQASNYFSIALGDAAVS